METSTTFDNIALFIKRAEEHQTKEFIQNAFASNNIGVVSEVKFIKKQNNSGATYNGVIVLFEKWNNNTFVKKLINEMGLSKDKTTRFYFNSYKYWIINVHQQKLWENEKCAFVDEDLSEQEQLTKYKEIVKTMATNIHYLETNVQRSETQIMNYEQKHTQQHLINTELMFQIEQQNALIKKMQKEAKIMETQLEYQRTQNKLIRNNLNNKISTLESYLEDEKQITKMWETGILER